MWQDDDHSYKHDDVFVLDVITRDDANVSDNVSTACGVNNVFRILIYSKTTDFQTYF
jgi:hypothetical protein